MTIEPRAQPAPSSNGALPAQPLANATATATMPGQTEAPARRPMGRPRVVIVGAGFGGLSAAKTLGDSGMEVLLLDRNNYHGFWPLLYQVATAGLEPEAIGYPVRAIVRRYRNLDFRMTEVHGVDFERRLVLTDGQPIPYDYLVLSAGSANNYFGNNALAEHTYGLKDIDDAERIRNHILKVFEQAAAETDPERRAALMTMVIIGGGPTGVEMAGAMTELISHVLRRDFPTLNMGQARVMLVEAGPTVLATFPPNLQQETKNRLARFGVEVRTGVAVTGADGESVTLKDGDTIPTHTVIWAAGVRGAELVDRLGLPTGRGNRVKVQPTLQLPDHPEVFIIGDMAYVEGYRNNAPFPMVAPVAIQGGEQAARNIMALAENRPLRNFRYFERGQMATIGRRAAVLDAFGIRLSGRLAWLGWLVVHLLLLIGFRNRVIVLINWFINYVTYDRGVRLISRVDC
ncbi:MAG: NAD(P)/FAD-dependent oxidoreductase [Chloroflexaceae bacterium]|nr:NAD(P)/FAD-dependent oxidoreductase [Chloroflexaceae bacterium]